MIYHYIDIGNCGPLLFAIVAALQLHCHQDPGWDAWWSQQQIYYIYHCWPSECVQTLVRPQLTVHCPLAWKDDIIVHPWRHTTTTDVVLLLSSTVWPSVLLCPAINLLYNHHIVWTTIHHNVSRWWWTLGGNNNNNNNGIINAGEI